jgi:hypothetical protein
MGRLMYYIILFIRDDQNGSTETERVVAVRVWREERMERDC